MTKETKYNLIFLAIILALLLPGAIILVRKQMSPGARRADLFDTVPKTVTYMDPQPTPPGMRRVAPPMTMQWFAKVVQDHAGPGAITNLTDSDGLPLMSDDKSFQLAAVREESSETRIWLASWNPAETDFFRGAHWSLSSNDQVLDGSEKTFEEIPIPNPVRDELGANGLLKPPKTMAWLEVEFPRASQGKWRITATSNGRLDHLVFVPSFTSPDGAKK